MVTIIDFSKRTNAEGEDFFALIVQGGIDMVASKTTGKFYATARKCSVPSTFDERTCQSLIGQQMPGTVHKVQCEPYEFVVQQTGEVITLNHHWEYSPEAETLDEVIFEGEVQKPDTADAQKPVFQ
jgi:hypothetical protein